MHPAIQLLGSYLKDPLNWHRNILWRIPRTVSQKEIIFIVGAPRSGTTLLQRILSVHDSLFSIEEETGLFSKQNIFRKEHFGLSKEINQHLFNESKDLVDFFDKAVSFLEKNTGKKFVEKTPQHVRYISFLLDHFPKSKFVHIYRDGRDCYCSARKHPTIPQKRSLKIFANYWKDCVTHGISKKNNSRVYQISYEDLAHNAFDEVSDLIDFLGLEFQKKQIDPQSISNDKRADMAAFSKLNKPINPSSCGRWEKELRMQEIKEIEKIAGKQLKELGYKLSFFQRD